MIVIGPITLGRELCDGAEDCSELVCVLDGRTMLEIVELKAELSCAREVKWYLYDDQAEADWDE